MQLTRSHTQKFLGFFDLQHGAQVVLMSVLINKCSGVVGVLAILSGLSPISTIILIVIVTLINGGQIKKS